MIRKNWSSLNLIRVTQGTYLIPVLHLWLGAYGGHCAQRTRKYGAGGRPLWLQSYYGVRRELQREYKMQRCSLLDNHSLNAWFMVGGGTSFLNLVGANLRSQTIQ